MTSDAIENVQAPNEGVETPMADLLAIIKRNPVMTAFVVAAAAVGFPFGMTGTVLAGITSGAVVGVRATTSPGLMNRIANAGWGAFGGACLSVFPIAGMILSYPLNGGTQDQWKGDVRATVHERIGNGENHVSVSEQAKLCNLSFVAWKRNCENVAFRLTAKVVSRTGAVVLAKVSENDESSPSYEVTLLPMPFLTNDQRVTTGSQRIDRYSPSAASSPAGVK